MDRNFLAGWATLSFSRRIWIYFIYISISVPRTTRRPMVRLLVNDDLERKWKEAVINYPGILLEGLRKITKILNEDSQCPGRDSNQALKDCK
jgi:hypothetical protein